MGNEEFMVLVLKRFDNIDENLVKMNERFDNVEKRLDDMEYILKATYDQTLKNTEQLSKYDYHFRRMDKKLESLNDCLLHRTRGQVETTEKVPFSNYPRQEN